MSINSRLTEVFKSAPVILFDDSSKFLLISDCHRGYGDRSDKFKGNEDTLSLTLRRHLERGFSYIEVGDADELYENREFDKIKKKYKEIFTTMGDFFLKKRLHLIWGNHDDVKKTSPGILHFHDSRARGNPKPLFEGITASEGLVLLHTPTGGKVFITHGHQGCLASDTLWPVAKLVVRHCHKICEFLEINKKISPAYNPHRRHLIEKRHYAWAMDKKVILICGHTHRYYALKEGARYANTGNGVLPPYITGITIENGQLSLMLFHKEKDKPYSEKPINEIGFINPIKLAPLFRSMGA